MGDRTGVLLVNLGTTAAPTPRAVRRYLREFLSDRNVVDKPPPAVWWLILNLFILPRRPSKIAPLYRSIWMDEGAPLLVHTRRQRDRMRTLLGNEHPVAFGMRYGEPSIETGLKQLWDEGCRAVLLLPMFPQVSKSTWITAVDEARRVAATWGAAPQLHVAEPFHSHPGYIEALASRTREMLQPDEHLLISFHGIPVRFVTEGDPYEVHCRATAEALAAALSLPRERWTLAYQSRFGREPWLEPETAATVVRLASTTPNVLAICPGFPADCLETVDEIGEIARRSFLEHGGRRFRLVPGLNDHPAWIDGLTAIAREGLAGILAKA